MSKEPHFTYAEIKSAIAKRNPPAENIYHELRKCGWYHRLSRDEQDELHRVIAGRPTPALTPKEPSNV